MSADNCAICPRCWNRAQVARENAAREAAEAYGKVSAEEYERLRAVASAVVDPDSFQTFREDYEFYGAADGVIHADYSGHCQTCGLSVGFKHERPFYTWGDV